MGVRLSKLFGMDIYSANGEYRGKVFDLIINLEKGKVETITTEALKPRTKQEAKRILSEKSIPYKKVKAAKDIIVVGDAPKTGEDSEEHHHSRKTPATPPKRITAEQLRFRH